MTQIPSIMRACIKTVAKSIMLEVKPGLTASEACHRLALIEGQKENDEDAKGGENYEYKVVAVIFGNLSNSSDAKSNKLCFGIRAVGGSCKF